MGEGGGGKGGNGRRPGFAESMSTASVATVPPVTYAEKAEAGAGKTKEWKDANQRAGEGIKTAVLKMRPRRRSW